MSLLRHQHPTLMLGRRPLVGTAPVVGALGTLNSVTSTTCAPTYPAGIAVGDICFLIAGCDNNSVITCPAGWQEAKAVVVDATYSAALFWRRCDGTETGAISLVRASSSPANAYFGARIGLYRGCVSTGPPYEGLTAVSGAGTAATGAAVTTYGINRLALQFWAWGGVGVSTADAAWTVVYQTNSGVGDDGSLANERKAAALPGTIAAPTRTLTLADPYVAIGLALVPA
jgi:hypothetical protein